MARSGREALSPYPATTYDDKKNPPKGLQSAPEGV